jgi:hypothetical protein
MIKFKFSFQGVKNGTDKFTTIKKSYYAKDILEAKKMLQNNYSQIKNMSWS